MLTNAFSIRNILISKERLLFVVTKLLKLSLKKIKRKESIKSQTFYYEFMFLN